VCVNRFPDIPNFSVGESLQELSFTTYERKTDADLWHNLDGKQIVKIWTGNIREGSKRYESRGAGPFQNT